MIGGAAAWTEFCEFVVIPDLGVSFNGGIRQLAFKRRSECLPMDYTEN
jgi:hypothetical protein|tara:strand:+ start:414 stop:557 length:144 start_codon:yes stop_codon:yes gene_type:complete